MNRIRVAAEAEADLDEIWLYIAQDSAEAADRFIDHLTSRFSVLASFRRIGRKREEIMPGVRSLAIGKYVIFYRLIERGVEIIRVLHGARDIRAL